MINLYIFNESSRAAVFGIGTYIRELTAALKNSEMNVCVVHLRSHNPVKNPETTDGVFRCWYIPSPINSNSSLDWNRQSELYYLNVVFLLKLQIKDTENLIFHLNFNQSGKLAEELKKVFDCKVICGVHYLNWCFSLSGNFVRFRQILASQETGQDEFKKSIVESYLKEKEFFESANRIICLSENTQQILQDNYHIEPKKITVIYNGLADRNAIDDKLILREKYHIPDFPIILFVGRLDDIKGLKCALQAFRIVLSIHPHCHFIISGNGSFDTYMEECEDIWTYVTWTGWISKEKLYDLYSIADLGIMPSFHEQCSYVAIEMMMHGVPLIASTSTGLKEMVEDGITGLHIPVVEQPEKVEIDSSLLAEKMLYLLQRPEERKRMGTNGRKRYEIVYSAEVFRQNMLNFYGSLFKE